MKARRDRSRERGGTARNMQGRSDCGSHGNRSMKEDVTTGSETFSPMIAGSGCHRSFAYTCLTCPNSPQNGNVRFFNHCPRGLLLGAEYGTALAVHACRGYGSIILQRTRPAFVQAVLVLRLTALSLILEMVSRLLGLVATMSGRTDL